MNIVLNIIWVVFGGLMIAIEYAVASIGMMVTIIGIPFGPQLFKIAGLALWPFGRDIRSGSNDGGCLSILMNIIWILFGGIEIAILHLGFGIFCCLTIVGIPFGVQHFKMALLALIPFGKEIH